MTNQQPQTDLQQAAEHVNPSELADNLHTAEQVGGDSDNNTTQSSAEQQTPFIDDALRTDK